MKHAPASYKLVAYRSKADGCIVVEVPDLPGCMADGVTYQETVENAQVIIGEWIGTARELGRPIPRPRGRFVCA